MNKNIFIIVFCIFLCASTVVWAEDGIQSNNKYGMSLLQPTEEDIRKTAELVNSKGGDYGYVTLVIQENDRDIHKWQDIFEKLREHHLIPIIRLATSPDGENWRRPEEKDADEWVRFLNKLNWITKSRYIVLFNEVNHGQEWGGETDPKGYVKVAYSFAKKLKETNNDFIVMLAGLDLSAPSSYPNYEDAETFYRSIFDFSPDFTQRKKPPIFNYIDGLASHSYPNPGFAGSPWDNGRKSIRGYDWELALIKSFGVEKNLPVFITETGWEKKCQTTNYICQNEEERIAQNFRIAYEQVWGPDSRVVAVTPFVFSYQSLPFLGFSWKVQGDGYYRQYETVQNLEKVKGEPKIIENGTIETAKSIDLVANSGYRLKVQLKNSGQGFWDKEKGYTLGFMQSEISTPFEYIFPDIVGLKPGESTEVSLIIKTKKPIKEFVTRIVLLKENSTAVTSNKIRIVVDPLPSLHFSTSLFPKLKTGGDDFELQLFDKNEELVFRKKGLHVRSGEGTIEEVQNIALEETYRIVLLKPYYLPRQTVIVFHKGKNTFSFKKMLPFDFSGDGTLNWADLASLIKNPRLIGNLVP